MPVPRLPKDIQAWARLYASHKVKDFEEAEFESGSNFKYESALRLRVLHNIKDLVIHKRGTLWIKDFDIFREWQTEAKEAIRGPHFAGLLEVVERANRPGGKWSADDFAEAGCFGPFLSLLGLIEQDGASKESGGSAVTYYDHTPPVAWRTRSHQEEYQYETPTKGIRRVQRAKINQNFNDSFMRMGFEDTPGTTESPQQPPSGQGSVAKYEQAKIDVQDEQTVNQCLINLMLPITWPLQISGNIDPQRQAFKFPIDDRKGYEARVDGIFTKPTRPADVIGILEVKKGVRTHEVRVQEAAQMVAFMRKSADQGSNDSEVKSRWLVSMCANQMFITIGTCKRPYLDFLSTIGKSSRDMPQLEEDTFLHMTEYGPFRLRYPSHLVSALEHLYILLCKA